jgi:hypothetical protein
VRNLLKTVSLLALIGVILPSILFLAGRMELDTTKWLMLVASIAWFVTAVPWMWKDNGEQAKEDEAVAP